ncbi:MAG: hypothetical protein ACLP62_02825 [Acidimicrobiales bacterium]
MPARTRPHDVASLFEALNADSVQAAVRALSVGINDTLELFDRNLVPALAGRWEAVKNFVRAWADLLDETFEAQVHAGVGEVVKDLSGAYRFRAERPGTGGQAVPWLRARVADAPGSPWVASHGKGLGIALTLIEDVRRAEAGLTPLPEPPSGFPDLGPDADLDRYRRLVGFALRGEALPLDRVQEIFGLSRTDTAQVFGVSRQAVQQWHDRGVPETHLERLDNLLALGELLERKLKPGQVPLVARRPAAAYGGKSLLDMVAAGRDRDVRGGLETALDWSATA